MFVVHESKIYYLSFDNLVTSFSNIPLAVWASSSRNKACFLAITESLNELLAIIKLSPNFLLSFCKKSTKHR